MKRFAVLIAVVVCAFGGVSTPPPHDDVTTKRSRGFTLNRLANSSRGTHFLFSAKTSRTEGESQSVSARSRSTIC